MVAPVWTNGVGFLGTLTERRVMSATVQADGANINYSLISGSLPPGLHLNTAGVIIGTPVSVPKATDYNFVVRATNQDGKTDNTFRFSVTGPSEPFWATPAGMLAIGPDGEYYTLNKEYVDYTLRAETDVLAPGNSLKYYIGDRDGQLPPGLKLGQDGRITGIVNDTLTVDSSVSITGGYDSEFYDRYPYEHGVLTQNVSDLATQETISKTYQFFVSVTDGIVTSRRLFSIKVSDPSSLRADTTYFSVDSVTLDISAGYLLAPIWQSKYGDRLPKVSNLGTVRAGRNQVLSLYTYDPYPKTGPYFYDWNTAKINPDIKLVTDSHINPAGLPSKNLIGNIALYYKDADIIPAKGMRIKLNESIPNLDNTIYTVTGVVKLTEKTGYLNLDQPLSQQIPDSKTFYVGTTSEHPPGLNLDTTSGTLYGDLNYQPSFSTSYRFTVQTIKIDQGLGTITLYDAIGDTPTQIVGKIFSASTGTVFNDLPDPQTYAGRTGDIVLINKTPNVVNPHLLPLMGGTNAAYVYAANHYNVVQTKPNTDNRYVVLVEKGHYPEPAVGWSIGNQTITTRISAVEDFDQFWQLTVDNQLIVDAYLTYWTLTDRTNPYWGYLGEVVIAKQVFSLTILGEITSSIQFTGPSNLGTLIPGQDSELYIQAVNTNTNYTIEYELVGGKLPPGLTLNSDGTVQGRPAYKKQTYLDLATDGLNSITFDGGLTSIDKAWKFTVRASDVYRLSATDREFSIYVNEDSLLEYTRFYVKPYMSKAKRATYQNFITDPIIFDPVLIYRPYDPAFGVQHSIKMIIETGIEKVDINLYATAMQQYFQRKQFYFGEVKSIMAQDSAGNNIYELIYAEIVDNLMVDKSTSAPVSYTYDGQSHTYYPSAVSSWQYQFETLDVEGTTISVDERLQPKYMTTLQADTGIPLGFVKAVPICYTIPGGGAKILSRIKSNGIDLNQFNFDIDRIIIETTKETAQTNWVMYPTSMN